MSEESKNLQPKETALPATRISETQVMALAQALEAVETYVPTTWVDNTEPDIDAEHLNHAEQGIKRVTDALNGAVATINNLSAQLANYIPVSKIVDNLLSNDAETVLSGKMGKQLSDLITKNSDAISTLNSETVLLQIDKSQAPEIGVEKTYSLSGNVDDYKCLRLYFRTNIDIQEHTVTTNELNGDKQYLAYAKWITGLNGTTYESSCGVKIGADRKSITVVIGTNNVNWSLNLLKIIGLNSDRKSLN